MTEANKNANSEDQQATTEIHVEEVAEPTTDANDSAPTSVAPTDTKATDTPTPGNGDSDKGKSFFKQRWVKVASFSAVGLLVLGIGAGIGAEIADDHFNNDRHDKGHSQVENQDRPHRGDHGRKSKENEGKIDQNSDRTGGTPSRPDKGKSGK